MISAAHQTMLNTSGSVKDIDWSYDTCYQFRNELANSLSPVGAMPTLVASRTMTKFANSIGAILSQYPGCIGYLGRANSSSSTLTYSIYDTDTGAWTDTSLSLDLGSTTFTGAFVVNRAGKLVFLNRYQGKVWCFNQDGTGLQYLGTTNTSFSTSFGVRMYANYDGTCTIFGEDTSNGKSYIVGEDYTITQGNNVNTTYPYSYMKFPNKVVVTGATGYRAVFNETMSSRLLDGTVSSYMSLFCGLYVSPFVRCLAMYGMNVLNTQKLGINYDALSDFSTSMSLNTLYHANGTSGAYLPTGEFFHWHSYHTSYPSEPVCFRIYNQKLDNITNLTTFESTAVNRSPRALPTGKYYCRYSDNGTIYFDLYDFGFSKKYFPPAMCISPYGYNGGQKNM